MVIRVKLHELSNIMCTIQQKVWWSFSTLPHISSDYFWIFAEILIMFHMLLCLYYYSTIFQMQITIHEKKVLTSVHRAPALLDTYTLGLLAKFLPTDPAIRQTKEGFHKLTTYENCVT